MMTNLLKVALVNDTSIYSKHFGCQLVGQTFREQFKRVGLDLTISLPKEFNLDDYSTELAQVDLVVVNGEGSIHHNANFHLLELADKYPSALVNCVYEQNALNPFIKKFKYISARESLSANEIRNQGAECDVVPDVIFASSFLNSYRPKLKSSGTVITDSYYKQYDRKLLFKRKDKHLLFAKKHSPASFISELLKHERVVAGRFHAAVACAVLGIPFSAWESNTWKTRGMMDDMKVPHLLSETRKGAEAVLPDTLDEVVTEYAENAKMKIFQLFETIHDIAAGKK